MRRARGLWQRAARRRLSTQPSRRPSLRDAPSLREFMAPGPSSAAATALEPSVLPPYLDGTLLDGGGRRVYIETKGCQMNVADTEVVRALLDGSGFETAATVADADVVLINTCAIRDGAERRIWSRLREVNALTGRKTRKAGTAPLVGLLGCMAERLKDRLLEDDALLDLVCGPDAYRELPRLLALARSGQRAIDVRLSLDETYADVAPVRASADSLGAFVSIMRGCNNMCSYCIVPFTRGRERSRDIASIEREVRDLVDSGVREVSASHRSYRRASDGLAPALVIGPATRSRSARPSAPGPCTSPTRDTLHAAQVTLLGQNVNSYAHEPPSTEPPTGAEADEAGGSVSRRRRSTKGPAAPAAPPLRDGFRSKVQPARGSVRFAELMRTLCEEHPEVRFRFTSPHPKDFPDDLLHVLSEQPNACLSLHIPAQSGSTKALPRPQGSHATTLPAPSARTIPSHP